MIFLIENSNVADDSNNLNEKYRIKYWKKTKQKFRRGIRRSLLMMTLLNFCFDYK